MMDFFIKLAPAVNSVPFYVWVIVFLICLAIGGCLAWFRKPKRRPKRKDRHDF